MDWDGTEYCAEMTDQGDLLLDASGRLVRDTSIRSRCRMRLRARRGEWLADPEMGSRFHTIKTLREAKRRVRLYAVEALQPLIDAGQIASVEVGEVEQNPADGVLLAEIFIVEPIGDRVSLGSYRMGE